MTFSLSSMRLDVDVKNGTTPVSKVVPGKGYGHVAETTPYHGYWPTTLKVTSSLKDIRQLQFRSADPKTWTWIMHFQPMDPAMHGSELLQCVKNLTNQETITVSVHDHSSRTPTSSKADVITIV